MKKDNRLPLLPDRKPRVSRTFIRMTCEEAAEMIERKCGGPLIRGTYGEGAHKIIILPEAALEFKTMVSYGRRSPMNREEQKYNGYGHFLDGGEGNVLIIVSHFIQIFTLNRSAMHASNLGPDGEYNPGLDFHEYYREEFLACEKEYNMDAAGDPVDPFLDLCGASEFVLEGHTHPDLGVFWSSTDKQTGAARAAVSPVCSFVCDPVRRQILGCVGKDFENAEVIFYDKSAPAPY